MFRNYYDSRMFPFLGNILFDELLNFDWDTAREDAKKIENGVRKARDNAKNNSSNYLQVLDEDFNKDIKFYCKEFELDEENHVYTYETTIGKEVKPEDIKIDTFDGEFYFSYSVKTENGEYSSATTYKLPNDLDTDTMKAVLKNGKLTITANQKVEEKEPIDSENDDEIEYEIEIGK